LEVFVGGLRCCIDEQRLLGAVDCLVFLFDLLCDCTFFLLHSFQVVDALGA